MWAKLRGYPAWPAQVLSVYAGHEAPPQPRPGCVLVHFFGTYDIQWLDNEKKARNRVGGHCDGAMADALSGPQVSPFRDNFEQNAAASKQKARSQHALQACTTLSCKSDKPFLCAAVPQSRGGGAALRGHGRRSGRRAASGHDGALPGRYHQQLWGLDLEAKGAFLHAMPVCIALTWQLRQAAKTAKGSGRGAKRGAGGAGGASGVPRRVRVARFLGLLPPAGGALQPLPILPCP